MDDATLERIVGIVRGMKSGGMSQDEIVDNLRQMGVAEEELSGILSKAGLQPQSPVPAEPATQPPIAEEHFERLHANVNELHAKHDDLAETLAELSEIRRELQSVKADVSEIKPLLGAMKRLNENLVEINKKMLARLGSE